MNLKGEGIFLQRLKEIIQRVRGFFPSELPKGSLEFDHFADSILSAYHLPDLPSYRHAIATMIMHLGPTTSHKSKFYFAKSIKKAMANQVAYEKIQEWKQIEAEKELAEKKAQQEAELAKQQSDEVTATTAEVPPSDDSPKE